MLDVICEYRKVGGRSYYVSGEKVSIINISCMMGRSRKNKEGKGNRKYGDTIKNEK